MADWTLTGADTGGGGDVAGAAWGKAAGLWWPIFIIA